MEPAFERPGTLSSILENENANDRLPGYEPMVSVAEPLDPDPLCTMHRSEDSDAQWLDSHEVCIIRAWCVLPDVPIPEAVTVKEIEPVVAILVT